MPQNADRTQRPPVPAHGSTGMTRFWIPKENDT
jgi:hypothetical protein